MKNKNALMIFKQLLLAKPVAILVILLGTQWPALVSAQEKSNQPEPAEVARIYRNPEERREAGLGTQLTDWLKFSGLIETETQFFNQKFISHRDTSKIETPSVSVQLGFDFSFNDWLTAEIVFEAEHDGQRFFADMDEGFINLEIEQWGLKIGRQYVTFGEYYSHFATGPMLEFGETRGTALIIDYSPLDNLEFSAYVFESEVGKRGGNPVIDWGANLDFASADESIRFGFGYLSDLAESDEDFIPGATFRQRVSAWNAYALIGFTNYEITVEVVRAISRFEELEPEIDKPFAFNLEFAYFPVSTTQLALRFEHSDEFEDQPKWQYGVAVTWLPVERVNISLEYLYGVYKNNFAFDDNDNELSDRHLIALQLALEF